MEVSQRSDVAMKTMVESPHPHPHPHQLPQNQHVEDSLLSCSKDSPFINFLNSLSPIKPVRCVHFDQNLQPFRITSSSSLITSPTMNVHDAKTLTRVPLPDVSKAEISSNKEMENSLNLVDTDMAKPSVCRTDRKENGKIGCSLDETTSSLHNSSHLSPQPLEYDFGCSEHNNSPFNGKSSEFKLVMSGSSAKEFAHSCLEGQSKFTLKCDAQLHMEEIEAICENMSNDLEDFCSSSSGPKNLGLKSAPFDGNDSTPYAYLALDAKSITSEAFENIFDASNLIPYTSKVDYRKHCSTRRRCLVFEMAGRKNMLDKSDGSSSNSMLYQRDTASSGMQLDTSKNNSGSSLFPLPSMGLHLNTLTSTSKKRMIIQENLVSSDLVNATCSDSLVPSLAAMKKPKVNFMPVNENPGSAVHGDQVPPLMQESPIEPAATSNELKRSNPKKKRFDNSKEDESCRRCNCKKSKCLKLYCECFAAGVYCTEPCACHNCFNKPIDEEIVLNTRKQIELRNPLAFAPKVIWTSEYTPEIGEDAIKTPASARHKRGCNCRRSNCLKKYCECFQGGVGCSVHCRCEGCRNSYGMKVGTDAVGLHEAKYVESESSSCHKDGEGENSQQGGSLTCVVQRDEKQDTELKMTLKPPLQICSKPTKLSLISTGKLMQSSKVVPGLKACKTILKSKISPIKPKFEQQCRVSEDETFEMLKECSSPISSVKVASPRRKRVSPPHNGTGMGPQKGLRKLVLKSISSSPSLTLDSNNPAIVPRNLLSSFPNKG